MSDRFERGGRDAPDGRATDRGVSEVISFTLIFSLIIATVALVYVSGIGGLEDTRSSEQVNNAERAFDVLADNLGDIHRQAAPSRATEIKVSDAQMEFGDPVRVNITIRNKLDDNASVVEYRPIVYSADSGTDLLYSNGALMREDDGGAVLDRNPSFLFTHEENDPSIDSDDEKTLILPVIETRNAGPESTGSQRTVLVRTLLATREVTLAEDDPSGIDTSVFSNFRDDNPDGSSGKEYNVTVRIRTSATRSDVWHDYLEERVDEVSTDFDARPGTGACDIVEVDGDPATETVECSLAAENVYSTATRVDVIYR